MRISQQLELLSGRIEKLPEAVGTYLKENKKKSKLHAEKECFAKIIQHHQKIFE